MRVDVLTWAASGWRKVWRPQSRAIISASRSRRSVSPRRDRSGRLPPGRPLGSAERQQDEWHAPERPHRVPAMINSVGRKRTELSIDLGPDSSRHRELLPVPAFLHGWARVECRSLLARVRSTRRRRNRYRPGTAATAPDTTSGSGVVRQNEHGHQIKPGRVAQTLRMPPRSAAGGEHSGQSEHGRVLGIVQPPARASSRIDCVDLPGQCDSGRDKKRGIGQGGSR